MYRAPPAGYRLRLLALARVTAGAMWNLRDRIRSTGGSVDCIDIGFGSLCWPTFNVADMAVSVGAFLLAWVLWQEDRAAAAQENEGRVLTPAGTAPACERGDPV